MLSKITKVLLIFIFFLISCYLIYTNEKVTEHNNTINQNFIDKRKSENIVGKILIDKININRNLYDINDSNNEVDKNITILKGSIDPKYDNSIFFLAAHSGSGEIAYFNDLNKLEKGDLITLLYNDIKYEYIVNNKWETKKDGDIEVPKENKKQLILTTCSTKDKHKQLIINCIEKES